MIVLKVLNIFLIWNVKYSFDDIIRNKFDMNICINFILNDMWYFIDYVKKKLEKRK